MQAGKGGGLAESFASAENMFGTQTNAFMVRVSTVLAVIFLGTSLMLAISGSKGEKSLMANKKLLTKVLIPVPDSSSKGEVTVKVESPKPMETLKPVQVPKPVVDATK